MEKRRGKREKNCISGTSYNVFTRGLICILETGMLAARAICILSCKYGLDKPGTLSDRRHLAAKQKRETISQAKLFFLIQRNINATRAAHNCKRVPRARDEL